MHKKTGLRENWRQFALLVIINAFVGGMVGLERSIFPQLAGEVFGIGSHAAILSFITAFGITKAVTNYFTGRLANTWGRKRLLVLGWLLAMPVPFILIYTTSWSWVVFANILLGASQGLAWSSTVVMKIDLAGPKNRGLAMGLNEFAGYLAVGVFAFLSAWLAAEFGIRPYPFYLGVILSIAGLLASVFLVRDTRTFLAASEPIRESSWRTFTHTTLWNRNLSAVTQAGFVNNLNDGMVWGLLPILLASLHFGAAEIGALAAVYPLVWGIGQLFTGVLADKLPRKKLLFWGMLVQGLVIVLMPFGKNADQLIGISVVLGVGTALVYPTFLAAMADHSTDQQRAESIGVFRFWRDLGYAAGAVFSGIIADLMGLSAAIAMTGMLTIGSAVVIQLRME